MWKAQVFLLPTFLMLRVRLALGKREHKELMKFLDNENMVIATGGGIITYDKSRAILQDHKRVVYLKTSIEKQIERATISDKRPLLIDTDPAI